MSTKAKIGIILGMMVVGWLGWLYTTYGYQTLTFLLRSNPETVWEYSKPIISEPASKVSQSETPDPSLPPIASSHYIETMSHTYQKLNNCGPSAAMMAASTLGVNFEQLYAAEQLKGGPTDKNVGARELVAFLRSQGLEAELRINGNARIVEQLVSRNIPVIAEQWLLKRDTGELVGHYRVVRGYNQDKQIFTTNDSFNGPNFAIPYSQFDEWWRPFSRTYIVVFTKEQSASVRQVLGSDWDQEQNRRGALSQAEAEVKAIGDGYSYFNLGTSYTELGEYVKAKEAYETALSHTFPSHFLWYQFGPMEAYYRVGEYERVQTMIDQLVRAAGESEETRYYRALLSNTSEDFVDPANPRFVPPFEQVN